MAQRFRSQCDSNPVPDQSLAGAHSSPVGILFSYKMISCEHVLLCSEAEFRVDTNIKDRICKILHLPPDHDLIKESDLVFLQMEHDYTLEERLDMARKLDGFSTKDIRF